MAVEARGNRQEVERRGEMKPLGQLLGVDFLECRIGKIGLFFDPETERYFEGDNMVEPRHAITTRVVPVDVLANLPTNVGPVARN